MRPARYDDHRAPPNGVGRQRLLDDHGSKKAYRASRPRHQHTLRHCKKPCVRRPRPRVCSWSEAAHPPPLGGHRPNRHRLGDHARGWREFCAISSTTSIDIDVTTLPTATTLKWRVCYQQRGRRGPARIVRGASIDHQTHAPYPYAACGCPTRSLLFASSEVHCQRVAPRIPRVQ